MTLSVIGLGYGNRMEIRSAKISQKVLAMDGYSASKRAETENFFLFTH